ATAELLRDYMATAPGALGFAASGPIASPSARAGSSHIERVTDASKIFRESPRTPSAAKAWALELGTRVVKKTNWKTEWGEPGEYLLNGLKPGVFPELPG